MLRFEHLQNTPLEADALRKKNNIKFSICTLVTKSDQYNSLIVSFNSHGFSSEDCEYIYIDNTDGNKYDCFTGYNMLLSIAKGEYIILCHQDICLINDGRQQLEAVIEMLNSHDPRWAAFGNAGGLAPGHLALRISDPHGENLSVGTLPSRVCSLDENFIVVRRDANLAVSHDLSGFHLYGADLCVIADMLGRSVYVVDFHLRHLSGGVKDENFPKIRTAMIRKYSRALRSRVVKTPSTIMFLTANNWVARLVNSHLSVRSMEHVGRWLKNLRG
jgi:hypothetical protein